MMNCRESIVAAVRVEFLNCLSNGHYDIEHKVNVHKTLGEGGTVDYNDSEVEYTIKSARFTRKENKDGGIDTRIKIVIE